MEAGAARRAVGAAERGVRRDPATAGGDACVRCLAWSGSRGADPGLGVGERVLVGAGSATEPSAARQGYWRMLGTRALWVGSGEDPLDCEGTTNWTAWPKSSLAPQSQHSIHGELLLLLEVAVKGKVTGGSPFRPHVGE